MFHTLIAPGHRPSPNMPRLPASTTLHGIVVAAAVMATGPSARGRVVRQLVRQTLSFRAAAGIMPP